MRILFVQLSDFHCCSSSSEYKFLIDRAIDAIATTGKYDSIVLIFSGDLTNSATSNEFKAGKQILGTFLNKLNERFNCGFIHTLIVPGNHDMHLTEDDRTANDILQWNLAEHLNEELNRLKSFYEYANSKKCFLSNKISDYKLIDLKGFKVKATLFNSAPYSTLKHDNKELHFIPEYAMKDMDRDGTADFYITVMHHSYEWCEWETKEMLKRKFQDQDFVFLGHDHKAETICVSDGNGHSTNMILGGEFSLKDKKYVFNVVALDSVTKSTKLYKFSWIQEKGIFIARQQINNHFIAKGKNKLTPTKDYLAKLSLDNNNFAEKFTDYYVFPKLKTDSEYFNNQSDNIDINNIFDVLVSNKIIAINGNSRSGKSTLIKYLYLNSVDKGFYPLLIEKRDYKDNKIEKMFENMVELQYGNMDYTYDAFKLIDHRKVIVFIDDFDLINNSKAKENLLTYIFDNNYLLVYTTKDYLTQDLMTIVKQKIQNESIDSLEILPFFKEKRDELVKNICTVVKHDNSTDIESIIFALDYMVQCRADLFSLTPSSLLQYIKYFINNSGIDDKGNKTISIIFETNIRNSIIDTVSSCEVNTYLSALEYMANYMYFTEQIDKITTSQLEICISNFNKSRKAHLNVKSFSDNCCKAKILVSSNVDFSFSFCDKNTYAYFVAKFVNWELEKNPNSREHINYIMNHICFGINDIIVLFLSYVRSNSRIILEIASKATELLSSIPELDFDNDNIPFIKFGKNLPKNLPSKKDKEVNIKETERIERSRQSAVKFRGIFDFSEEDIDKTHFRVLRAFRYTQIIARALVDQYGSLENDEIINMTQT